MESGFYLISNSSLSEIQIKELCQWWKYNHSIYTDRRVKNAIIQKPVERKLVIPLDNHYIDFEYKMDLEISFVNP